MKMMFHIDDFKCVSCSNWFCPPFNLPYLLPCTHSICTGCLHNSPSTIICPYDLEECQKGELVLNTQTKRALERLTKYHRIYSYNSQLYCIKNLTVSFDNILSSKEKNVKNFGVLLDQIFISYIYRLKKIHTKVKMYLNRPYKIVEDWKEIVSSVLTAIRKNYGASAKNGKYNSKENYNIQLNHYIYEGRKMKMEINSFFNLDFDLFAERLMRNSKVCFEKDFGICQETLDKLANCSKKLNETILKQEKYNIKSIRESSKFCGYSTEKKNNIYDQSSVHYQSRKDSLTPYENHPLSKVDLNCSYNSHHASIHNQSKMSKMASPRNSVCYNSKVSNSMNFCSNDNLQRYMFTDSKYKNLSKKQNEQIYTAKKQSYSNGTNLIPFTSQKNSDISLNSNIYDIFKDETNEQYSRNYHNYQNYSIHYNSNNRSCLTQLLRSSTQSRKSHHSQLCYDAVCYYFYNGNNLYNVDHSRKYYCRYKVSPSNSKRWAGNDTSFLISPYAITYKYTYEDYWQRVSRKSNRNCEENFHDNCDNYNENMDNYNEISQNLLHIDHNLTQNEAVHFNHTEYYQLLTCEDHCEEIGTSESKINFLKPWNSQDRKTSINKGLEVKRATYYYNCYREKLSYMKKMQLLLVDQTFKLTKIGHNSIELINYSLHDVYMNYYLQCFDWGKIYIVKFVKTALTDHQLNTLLNHLLHSKIKVLVLCGNNLTDICLDAFLNFVSVNYGLKAIYLAKNYINGLRNKNKVSQIRQKGVNVYV